MKKLTLFNSLYTRVAISIVLTLSLCFLIFTYLARLSGLSLLEQVMHAKADAVVEVMRASLYNAMLNNRAEDIKKIIAQISQSRDVIDLRVLSKNNSTIWGIKREDIVLEFDKFKKDVLDPDQYYYLGEYNGVKAMNVLLTIPNRPPCYRCHDPRSRIRGYVYARVSMADIQSYVENHKDINHAMIVITLLVMCGLSIVLIHKIIIKPIKNLGRELKNVSDQVRALNLDDPVRIESKISAGNILEINQLMESFNDLIDRLNFAYSRLKEVHDERMKYADKMANVGEIAAGLAHEIKNPVSGVLSALQVAIAEFNIGESERGILREMRTQLMKVDRVIKDLLQFARPKPPNKILITINSVLIRTLSFLEPQLEQKKVKVNIYLDEALDPVLIDPDQIQQVMINIILNAIDAMPEGRSIKITTNQDDRFVHIYIQDEGRGIRPEEIDKIFEPFYTTKPGGTGLGLAISKRIIENHGGTIDVKSELGAGATFIINIPKK